MLEYSEQSSIACGFIPECSVHIPVWFSMPTTHPHTSGFIPSRTNLNLALTRFVYTLPRTSQQRSNVKYPEEYSIIFVHKCCINRLQRSAAGVYDHATLDMYAHSSRVHPVEPSTLILKFPSTYTTNRMAKLTIAPKQ